MLSLKKANMPAPTNASRPNRTSGRRVRLNVRSPLSRLPPESWFWDCAAPTSAWHGIQEIPQSSKCRHFGGANEVRKLETDCTSRACRCVSESAVPGRSALPNRAGVAERGRQFLPPEARENREGNHSVRLDYALVLGPVLSLLDGVRLIRGGLGYELIELELGARWLFTPRELADDRRAGIGPELFCLSQQRFARRWSWLPG